MILPLIIAFFTLTAPQAEQIGKKIWENESGGRFDGLTSWNDGEEFASMGINHFIWYPEGKKGPFEETFPLFLKHLQNHAVSMPHWLENYPPCPWNSKKDFMNDFEKPKMLGLRQFLRRTQDQQILFVAERLDKALHQILDEATKEKKEHLKTQIERLMQTPKGPYILLDYYNFKGGGILSSERYKDEGWGLLQVLENMPGTTQKPNREFAEAAAGLLKKRVANAPEERNEKRWLNGWLNRISTYE